MLFDSQDEQENILGIYPVPRHAFEKVSMDLAENSNEVNTFKNLLIAQDVLTKSLLLFPMKSKLSKVLMNIFMYSIFSKF
jgi:hypothetical protein